MHRKSSTPSLIVLSALALTPLFACEKSAPPTPPVAPQAKASSPLEQARAMTSAFAALPKDYARKTQTKAHEDLGRMLYYEPRLSKNHDISCNSCHDLSKGGVDSLPTSPGDHGQLGSRNSPTVYNAAGHFQQFWDGRAADVEAQAKGPILNSVEMAMPDEELVLATLKSIPGYVDAFALAFPDDPAPITYDHVAQAIGAFERKLVTPSRWDTFLKGDDAALSEDELLGFIAFNNTGCVGCHNGALLGGQSFQKLGVVQPWPELKDHGLFDLTKKEEDQMRFKTPSLRNVTITSPYLHDGSIASLNEMVKLMAAHQLGQYLKEDELTPIISFLKTLEGKPPQDYIAKPMLPADGPSTPQPDPT